MGDMGRAHETPSAALAGTSAMAGEHGAALVALLYLPVAVMALLTLLEAVARSGWPPAARFRTAYLQTPPAIQMAALGMVISAVVHLALVPQHLAEEPVLGVLFALDGAGLLAVSMWSLTRPVPGWRIVGVVLLAVGVLAYLGYVLTGAESPDAVGIATKVIETAAIGLLVLPGRIARLALPAGGPPCGAVHPSRHFGGQIR